jgi:hypothetical protein
MNLFLFYFLALLQSQSSNSQVEFIAGGGAHKNKPAQAFEIGFDATSDQISVGLVIPFLTTVSQNTLNFEKKMWDTPTDYAHILRYLTWKGSTRLAKVGFRIGEEHSITLGNGSIVNSLNYLLLLDHPHTGFQGGFEHENFKGLIFADDFVDPHGVGFFLELSLWNNISFGASLFSDFQMPLTMENSLGEIAVDSNKAILLPFTTERFTPMALSFGYKYNSYFKGDLDLVSLDFSDKQSLGAHLSFSSTIKTKNYSFDGKLSIAGGGNHFAPWVAGPLYLLKRVCNKNDGPCTGSTLLHEIQTNQSKELGFGVNFGFSFKSSININSGWKRSFLGNLMDLSIEIIVSKRAVIALYAATDGENNHLFSTESRISLWKGWFFWGRAKQLFAIFPGNDYYSPASQFLAGVGYRETTENSQ